MQVLGTRGAGYQTQARECYTHRVKTSDFSSGKSHRCPLQSRSLGTPVFLALWLILAFSALLPCPQPSVHILAFPGFGSVKSKWVLCLVFWNLVTGPTLFLPARGTLSQWGAGSACGMGWCSKTKLLFLHFCVVILLFCFGVFFLERGGLFCSLLYCIADASETYLRALPSCFCFCIAKYWSFGRDVGWGLPLCHLGDSSP